MSFDVSVLTMAPEAFPGPLGVSVIGNAWKEAGLWRLETVDIRKFSKDKRGFLDDTVRAYVEHLAPLRGKPMWIGWGLRDFVFDRAFYDEFVRRFPEAEAHAWEDAGHYVMEDARERIVPAVREFLARHPVQEPA